MLVEGSSNTENCPVQAKLVNQRRLLPPVTQHSPAPFPLEERFVV